jgi:HAD superfamily hydrolase (TIGR01509 family)
VADLEKLSLDVFEAVIFDMDGVLLDSMPYHAEAWMQVLARAGVTISRDEVYEHEGEAGAVSLRNFLAAHGQPSDPERLQALLAEKESVFKRIARVKLFDGVPEFIAELHGRGKRLAIVTGTSLPEVETILLPELLRKFEVVVTGDQVTHGKPDPEPYLTALRRLNLPANRALVIENAPLGVRSAKAAGLICLAVETSMQCPRLPGADRCFADLASLAEFLLQPA